MKQGQLKKRFVAVFIWGILPLLLNFVYIIFFKPNNAFPFYLLYLALLIVVHIASKFEKQVTWFFISIIGVRFIGLFLSTIIELFEIKKAETAIFPITMPIIFTILFFLFKAGIKARRK
jgi:hypothetical protein